MSVRIHIVLRVSDPIGRRYEGDFSSDAEAFAWLSKRMLDVHGDGDIPSFHSRWHMLEVDVDKYEQSERPTS